MPASPAREPQRQSTCPENSKRRCTCTVDRCCGLNQSCSALCAGSVRHGGACRSGESQVRPHSLAQLRLLFLYLLLLKGTSFFCGGPGVLRPSCLYFSSRSFSSHTFSGVPCRDCGVPRGPGSDRTARTADYAARSRAAS